jgi:hypothetical protein
VRRAARGSSIAAAALAALLGACGAAPPRPRAPAAIGPRCYDLPGASRYSLRVRGDHLYWIERTVEYDYAGDSVSATRLVALDRATGHAAVIAAGADAPYRLLDDGGVLFRRDGAIVLWRPAGGGRIVSPRDLAVAHFELAPDQASVVAVGDDRGERAAYALRVDGVGGARRLGAFDDLYAVTATDALLGTGGTALFRAPLDGGPVVPVATLTTSHIADVVDGWLVHYEEDRFLARPLATPDAAHDTVVLPPPGGWYYTQAPDHLFVKRVDGPRARAARIEGGTLRALPTLIGGPAIVAAEPIDAGVVALVAFDTDHSGTADDTRDEIDVCTLPATGDVTLPARQVPRRLAAGEAALAALAAQAGLRWRVYEDAPGPLTVELSAATPAGGDLAAARAQVQALAAQVVAALGDPEIRVIEVWADGRTASSFTDGDTHRRVVTAGLGRATLAEPRERDLIIEASAVARADDKITCSGTVTNPGPRPLAGATARCQDSGAAPPIAIAPDPLPPGATGHFQAEQPALPEVAPLVWFSARGAPLLTLRAADQAEHRTMYDAAVIARDRSRLTLWTWTLDDGDAGPGAPAQITVDVDAPAGFADFSGTAQEVAATAAFAALAPAARAALGAAPTTPVRLRIALGDDSVLDYDGAALHGPHPR